MNKPLISITSGLYFAFRKRNPYINGLSICCPNRQAKLIRSENNSLENNMKKLPFPVYPLTLTALSISLTAWALAIYFYRKIECRLSEIVAPFSSGQKWYKSGAS